MENDFPKPANKKPNKKTVEAVKELEEGKGVHSTSLDEFWDKIDMNPNV